jgi:hypothetical protein
MNGPSWHIEVKWFKFDSLVALEVMEQNPWGNVKAYNLEYLGI